MKRVTLILMVVVLLGWAYRLSITHKKMPSVAYCVNWDKINIKSKLKLILKEKQAAICGFQQSNQNGSGL